MANKILSKGTFFVIFVAGLLFLSGCGDTDPNPPYTPEDVEWVIEFCDGAKHVGKELADRCIEYNGGAGEETCGTCADICVEACAGEKWIPSICQGWQTMEKQSCINNCLDQLANMHNCDVCTTVGDPFPPPPENAAPDFEMEPYCPDW